MATKRIVFFEINGQVYGLDVFYTQGIEKSSELLAVPGTLPYIKGLINLRGEVIPVYSLRKKFGMEEKVMAKERELIIVKLSDERIKLAFEVDRMREIKEIDEEKMSGPPVMIQSDTTAYIKDVIHMEKNLSIMINPDGLLTKEEKEKIKDYLNELAKKEKEEKGES